ncbi:hypothetical protein Prudu_936S000200, partial [Prunus dulcis]
MSEMDKSWMHSDRRSKAYEFGVEAFLNFAVENLLTTTHIRCPCVKCVNLKLFGVGIIRDHVYFNGIDQSYKNWTFHGEPWEATTNASRNVEEDDGHSRYSFVSEEIDMDDNDFGDFGSDPYEFALRAALMWTINDFPAYETYLVVLLKDIKLVQYGDDTPSHRLKNGHKICYIGHRKWLPINHPYRRQRAAFNGKPEYGIPPEPLTGEEVLHMVENGDRVCWKKKSIFFDLEYWKYLPVRHALDVMHIEKNVCDSIIGTLLEIPGKNKDGIAARLDLLNMGVKTDLQPKYGERRTRLPPGPWNLSRAEKREVPEGYSSNIKNLVSLQDSRLLGLKSHDCHTLMQQLLPVAIRSVLEKPARYAITRLCFFFNAICAKTVDVSKLDKLEEDVVVTLCLLEKYFPPSFFDIMVHLVVHLVREVRLCGPVYFRWMYPFERYMKVLKGYVQNRTRPEGCIAERYIAEEAVEFCTQHLSDVSTVGVPSSQKMGVSKPLSGCTVSVVDQDLLNQAHLYVLENTEEVLPYIEYVQSELEEDNHGVSENLRWLAAGPNMAVPLYRSYLIKVLGDVIIECEPFTRGMPNVDTFDELVGELGGQNIRGFWPQKNQYKKYWIQITSLYSA